jgi:oligopeptide/dipeptide ABC transporter ATP-binding protein
VTSPLLEVRGLSKHFPVTRGVLGRVVGQVRAVDDVSFDVAPGETLGVVGESGCGKTTVGRCILRLIEPTSGTVRFDGIDVTRATPKELVKLRRHMQVVFQDPYSSLNPRMRVVDIVGEALEVHGLAKGAEVERTVADLLRRVGLSPSWINRYPHEFSGGQRQRIGVARAIALGPKLVVCDEAVSALDVSIQAQVVNLFIELRREMGLSYLFIAHDLSVVRHVSHRVAVMYLGEIAELAPSKRLFAAPAHPYTRALLSAIPVPDPRRERRRVVLAGDVPTPLNPPGGCRFHTRCPAALDRCRSERPPVVDVEPGHTVRCLHAEGLAGDPDWYRRLDERIANAMQHVAARAPSPRPRERALPAPPDVDPARHAARDGGSSARPREESPRSHPPGSEPGAARGAALALSLLGVVLVAIGWPVFGLLLAGAAYAAGLRPKVRARRTADAAIAVSLVVALLVSRAVAAHARTRAVRAELSALSTELEDRKRTTGSYPSDLAELGWRLYPLFAGGRALDPWGHPFRYRAPGRSGRPFDLSSDGPDGAPSADDVAVQ